MLRSIQAVGRKRKEDGNSKGITSTTVFLERFFENLLIGYQNDLKNRYIHVDYEANSQSAIQSVKTEASKCKN